MRLADEVTLSKKPDLRILSLGAGVQSSTLLMKIYNGEIAPIDMQYLQIQATNLKKYMIGLNF